MQVPSALGIYALGRSPNPARWPSLYYYPSTSDDGEPLTWWKSVRVLVPDTLILVGACLGTYRLGTFESLRYFQSLNYHLWLLPQLPSVLIGYCILAASYAGIKNRFIVIIFIYTVLLLVGTVFALATYFQIKGYGEGYAEKVPVNMTLIGVQYGVMIIPWTLLTCCLPGILFFFYIALCMIARILSFGMDMEIGPFDSPFCGVNLDSFSYAVITFGVLAWLAGSVAAILCHRHHDQLWGWGRGGRESRSPTFVPLDEAVHHAENTMVYQQPNGVPDPKRTNDD
ncbi:hypothetical protein FQN54_006295 [Arachnomyces sp. PD_36]|nr:hypothetical protein FQN54_006295 [Arachnomyces sp. PD_36]